MLQPFCSDLSAIALSATAYCNIFSTSISAAASLYSASSLQPLCCSLSVLQPLCYNLRATASLLQSTCYSLSATFSLLQSLCCSFSVFCFFITTFLLQPLCFTASLLQPPCYSLCYNLSATASQLHSLYFNLSAIASLYSASLLQTLCCSLSVFQPPCYSLSIIVFLLHLTATSPLLRFLYYTSLLELLCHNPSLASMRIISTAASVFHTAFLSQL